MTQQQKKTGKRKRPFGETTRVAYASVSFKSVPATGHPRSPHRFFKESYTVEITKEALESDQAGDIINSPRIKLAQVVHHHVNGLCIVTAGRIPPEIDVEEIKIMTTEAPACSAAEKRKRQAKMLKGGKVKDSVEPTTKIAELVLASGESVPIHACVWGTILELNHSLTPTSLKDDPLLDGFVAVILPSGDFPPKESQEQDSVAEGANKLPKGE